MVSLAFVGAGLVREQRRAAQEEAGALFRAELETSAATLTTDLERLVSEATAALAALPGEDPTGLRLWSRGLRRWGGVIVVGADGKTLVPPEKGPLSAWEREFLGRIEGVRRERLLEGFARGGGSSEGARRGSGVHPWYDRGGLNLLVWRLAGERVAALEVRRSALLAHAIAALPDSAPAGDTGGPDAERRTALLSVSGDILYQWGGYAPPDSEAPRLSLPLGGVFGAWRLARWQRPAVPMAGGDTLAMAVWAGLGGLALALAVLALFVYRERTREMRVASQRLTFVSQVSHELRTPLTNIRLYAELLATDLEMDDDGDEEGGLHEERLAQLGIVIEESERLTRLIGNVLSFARGQQGRLELRPGPGAVDDVLSGALGALRPSLTAAGVDVETALAAPERCRLDRDAIEQIVTNLLSNVVKYAREGGWAQVSTRRRGDEVEIRVADHGPGIPIEERERVFQPFVRLSDRLRDGVAGAGIGLDIARRLARLHGGDLRLDLDSAQGAVFVATLHVPLLEEQGARGSREERET